MKKVKQILIYTMVLVACIAFVPNVFAKEEQDISLGEITICPKNDNNCSYIMLRSNIYSIQINGNYKEYKYKNGVMEDHDFGDFEIKDGVIYVKNKVIDVYQTRYFDNFGNKRNIIFNVEGDNKINYIDNINRGYSYKNNYIPFTITGTGSVELNNYKKPTNFNKNGEAMFELYSMEYGVYDDSGEFINPDFINFFLKNIDKTNDIYVLRTEKLSMSKNEFVSLYKDIVPVSRNIGLGDKIFSSEDELDDYIEDNAANLEEINSTLNEVGFDFGGYDSITQEYLEKLFNSGLMQMNFQSSDTKVDEKWAKENINTCFKMSKTEDDNVLLSYDKDTCTTDYSEDVTEIKNDTAEFETKDAISPYNELSVKDVTDKISDEIKNKVKEQTKKQLIKVYDINIINSVTGNKVEMKDGEFTLKLKIDDTLQKYKDYAIVYISEDGEIEELESTIKDGYIVFNTTHLSNYGIVGNEKITEKLSKGPQTNSVVVTSVALLIVLGAVVVISKKRLKKLN